jgi:hypothetical protein
LQETMWPKGPQSLNSDLVDSAIRKWPKGRERTWQKEQIWIYSNNNNKNKNPTNSLIFCIKRRKWPHQFRRVVVVFIDEN